NYFAKYQEWSVQQDVSLEQDEYKFTRFRYNPYTVRSLESNDEEVLIKESDERDLQPPVNEIPCSISPPSFRPPLPRRKKLDTPFYDRTNEIFTSRTECESLNVYNTASDPELSALVDTLKKDTLEKEVVFGAENDESFLQICQRTHKKKKGKVFPKN
ncbi:unnamed protein product, partial [Ceratitis capitata]